MEFDWTMIHRTQGDIVMGIMYVPSDPDAIVIREERKLTISSDFELYGIGTVVAPLKAESQKEQR